MRTALVRIVLSAIALLLLLVYNEQRGGRAKVTIIESSSLSAVLAAYSSPELLGSATPPPPPASLSLSESGSNARGRNRVGNHHDGAGGATKHRHAVTGHVGNCSGHGQALVLRSGSDGWAHRCLCAPGWKGEACELREDSPCNTPEGGRVLTRCAGTCDKDVNRCLCGPGSRFPHRPMVHCRYEGVEKDMPWQTPGWAGFAWGPKHFFWTSPDAMANLNVHGAAVAWCDADPALSQRPLVYCECYEGQRKEQLCAPVAPRSVDTTFCLSQCHGRGECRSGYCHCHEGYGGADCSLARNGEIALPTLTAERAALVSTVSVTGAAGVSAVPRPRVYVYELPGEFNTFLAARRQAAESCVLRDYVSASGGAKWSSNLYGAEVALHEALLVSPHRVSDPEEADYFFVPSYGGCFISEFNRPSPSHWLCDRCHKGKAADLASLRQMRWNEALLQHLAHAYPYWNRSDGADHLWPFTHDEGACYAPTSLRHAILLVHWGRTHFRPNGSSEYHLWRVRPYARRMYGWRRCYDPCKDVVVPSWRKPEAFAASPYLRKSASTPAFAATGASSGRTRLFYFNGNLGLEPIGGGPLSNYSVGLRQQLHALFGRMEPTEVVVTDQKAPDYSAALASSVFCGVLPGWGWSGRMEDAVLHGCIPVIMQDGIHTPWESVLDAHSYSVRVRREEMPNMVRMLRAMAPERVRELQLALAAAWPRFSYLANINAEQARRGRSVSASAAAAAGNDATATLLQVLLTRLRLRDARRTAAAKHTQETWQEIQWHLLPRDAIAGDLAPAPGCQVSVAGDDISPAEDGSAPESTFEGRTVNGWVI